MQEALAKRPIVLLGDVGCGKSSFLKRLMLLAAPKEFERALYIHIDLGTQATLESDLRTFVLREIERQLLTKYGVDLEEDGFVRGVYDLDVAKRFRSSVRAKVFPKNRIAFEEAITTALVEKVNDRTEHLRRSISHIARARTKQVIIIIDDADQRESEVQQTAFLIAQEFAKNWEALTFIALRPQTFYASKKSGALSAYPHRVFTIAPPRPELVIQKRLEFAILVAEGKLKTRTLDNVRFDLGSVADFLKVMVRALLSNQQIGELFANISGSNIRLVVDFATNFIGNPNVDANRIVDSQRKAEGYIIPVHDFSRAAILGDNIYYYPPASMASNLFDVSHSDQKEHFLGPLALSFILSEEAARDADGFVKTTTIIEQLQQFGFLNRQISQCLRRLSRSRLIEPAERVLFEKPSDIAEAELPLQFRPTNIGAYHVNRWLATFVYLDAMVVDTPIFDSHLFDELCPSVENFELSFRFDRASRFRDYLTGAWNRFQHRPSYFDWDRSVAQHGETYQIVQRYLERRDNIERR